jgi:putative transposase
MARLARVVVPGLPHHVTQRGVRSLPIFRDDSDRKLYLELMSDSCAQHGVEILVWCLMDNHVHFVAVPHSTESLAKAFGEAHKAYTREHNFREGVRGYLFQGRFGSYVMDESHLLCAARYILCNPVAAHMVDKPEKWAWSSARFHLGRRKTDPLIKDPFLFGLVSDWKSFFREEMPEEEATCITARLSTGRPAGSDDFLKMLELSTGRSLIPRKGGWPKGKRRN